MHIEGENTASDVNNKMAHDLSRSRNEKIFSQPNLEVSRVENGLPCDTMLQHVLTCELGKRNVEPHMAGSGEELSESVVEVVTTNANENTVQDLSIQTIESDELNELYGQLDNGSLRASYTINAQPGFKEQIKQYKQYHRTNQRKTNKTELMLSVVILDSSLGNQMPARLMFS